MKNRNTFLLSGCSTCDVEATHRLEIQILSLLRNETLIPEFYIKDPEQIIEKMIENEGSAFIYFHRVPGSIYKYFSSPEGIRIMQIYNISFGYITVSDKGVKNVTYCLNKRGKIHSVFTPVSKKRAS